MGIAFGTVVAIVPSLYFEGLAGRSFPWWVVFTWIRTAGV